MFGNIFAPLAMKISGGIVVALAIALAVTVWRADTISEQRDTARKQVVTEQALHAVTAASLDSLSAQMAALVKEGQLRKERLSEALVKVERDTAPLREQADAIERGEIDITTVEGL